MQTRLFFHLTVFVVLAGTATSCDPDFQPFEDNEAYIYSIQGVLDPLKEIQNIRISPVRQSFRQSTDPFDAVVTLTHIESGNTVTMEAVAEQFADGAWAWNYTTDMPIQYENTYRLTATRSDEQFSRATARIPKEIVDPQFTCHCEEVSPNNAIFVAFEAYMENVEKLAVARVTYNWGARGSSGFFGSTDPISNRLHQKSVINNGQTSEEPGGSRVWVDFEEDMEDLADEFDRNRSSLYVNSMQLEIVSGGPEWPETSNIPLEEQSLAVINGNVENGIGRLAGAVGLDNIVVNHNYSCPLIMPEVPEPCAWLVEEE